MDFLRTVFELIDLGGPVMVPLALLSAWMWVLIVLKADWIWRVNRQSLSVSDAMACLETGVPEKAPASCPKALALDYFLSHHFQGRACLAGEPDQLFLEVAVKRQMQGLYRHIPTIMILASAAPLLGLLGTVTGMVETFRVMGLYGMGNAQAMASGIKEALITTQAGLLVAIPGLLAGQAMRRKVQGIHQEVLIFHRAVNQWLEKEWQQCTIE